MRDLPLAYIMHMTQELSIVVHGAQRISGRAAGRCVGGRRQAALPGVVGWVLGMEPVPPALGVGLEHSRLLVMDSDYVTARETWKTPSSSGLLLLPHIARYFDYHQTCRQIQALFSTRRFSGDAKCTGASVGKTPTHVSRRYRPRNLGRMSI